MLIHRLCLLPPAISNHKPVPVTSSFVQRFPTLASGRPRRPMFKFCRARRRVIRYEEDNNVEEEEEEEEEEEHGYNAEIAMLESYTESARSEVLLVRATVDGAVEQVLIFKGYSSCLSSRTAIDPSKSVLPAKAIIQSIDVIKGPFDPSCIEYLQKGLTLDEFIVRSKGKLRK
ncbi:hypothetical protein IEQ34_010779 [Dendrobium chrysotoxum]|uniref:DUF7734 domain-containing protein n=1 Tax=Dendrobium chrysotoxum TaxID=161865 RepID=A0AAV7GVR6_DENCH|nr:hypothetical protein IEQ34_010779 [Dendrobium chrysotoxum]